MPPPGIPDWVFPSALGEFLLYFRHLGVYVELEPSLPGASISDLPITTHSYVGHFPESSTLGVSAVGDDLQNQGAVFSQLTNHWLQGAPLGSELDIKLGDEWLSLFSGVVWTVIEFDISIDYRHNSENRITITADGNKTMQVSSNWLFANFVKSKAPGATNLAPTEVRRRTSFERLLEDDDG